MDFFITLTTEDGFYFVFFRTIIILISIYVFLYFSLKRLLPLLLMTPTKPTTFTPPLHTVNHIYLTRHVKILIVKAGEKYLLLSQTPQRVTLLTELDNNFIHHTSISTCPPLQKPSADSTNNQLQQEVISA